MTITPLKDISERIVANLGHCFMATEGLQPSYRGKVRDVFDRGDELIIVATDRVSAFDQVLGTIPFKGALLTEQSTLWLQKATPIIKTHLLAREDAQIQRCRKANPFKFEIIVRGYLTGTLLREPADVRGQGYGLRIDPNIGAYQCFEKPLLTPTTKADVGLHDEPISLQNIVSSGLATTSQLDLISDAAMQLFALGTKFADERGLILVDTKYEFGLVGDEVFLIDEIHTADSSRYWVQGTYEQRLSRGLEPEMLDKERLRRVLIAQGVDPKGTSQIPPLTDEMRSDLALHYWHLTEQLTGQAFVPPEEPANTRVTRWLNSLSPRA
jgi:phosphoribosylaminoimidazole-succinocarboxamide synthase